jgi:dTDP-glucose 4,6-dehydratase
MIKKKYLIIGSNSFSGSHFINFLLKKNIKVIGVSRSIENPERFLSYKKNKKLKNFSFYQIDLNKSEHVKKLIYIIKNKNIDHIINFSAQGMVGESWKNPVDWYQTNVIAQINFFQELKDIKSIKKYVHFTTPEVYGHTKKLIEEESDFNPSTPYAVSRAACDMHLNVLHQNYNFPVIFTRTANVYGPFQRKGTLVDLLIKAWKKKKILKMTKCQGYRDYIFVDDVANGIIKILLNNCKKNCDIYNLGSQRCITIKDFIVLLSKTLNFDNRYLKFGALHEKKEQKQFKSYLVSEKAYKILAWKPYYTLKKGFEKIADLRR